MAAGLAPFVRDVVAIDGSAPMLTAARQRLKPFGNVELRHGELEDLPVEDATFDAATLVLALHHVASPASVLVEAARVLKPGGRLVVVDTMPHDREEFRREMGHVWLGFAEESIRELTAQAGMALVRYQPLPGDPAATGPALFVTTAQNPGSQTPKETTP